MAGIFTPEIVSAHAMQLLKERIAEREEIERLKKIGKPHMMRMVATEHGVRFVDAEDATNDPR